MATMGIVAAEEELARLRKIRIVRVAAEEDTRRG
jgi:hypothetical protein